MSKMLTGSRDMQNCFREYPEVYGNELEGEDDDEVGDDELAALAESESAPSEKAATSRPASEQRPQEDRAQAEVQQRKKEQALGGSDEVIPREAHDDRVANAGKKAIKEKEQH
jgi:intermembrane space import and assembly protein 40